MKKTSEGLREPPSGIRNLDSDELEDVRERFWHLCEVRSAPLPRNPHCTLIWPRPTLEARCVPEGVHPLDAECGFDHDVKLERFFERHAPEGVVVWHPEAMHFGAFLGPYNEEMRIWTTTNFFTGDVCYIAKGKDLVLIADNDLNFSVIGAAAPIISDLEEVFGGADALKQEFTRHVDVGDLAISAPDQGREWAWKYLMPWCGWS